jgi:hypothetical protein
MNLFKKNYLSFVLLLFVGSNVFAQNSDSIKNYYSFINQAELSIVDSNLQRASKLFVRAFEFKSPHEKDLINCFFVHYYLRDSADAKNYANRLANLGLNSLVLKDREFDNDFYDFVFSDYDVIQNSSSYLKKKIEMNSKYKTFNKLADFDQFVRQEKFKSLAGSARYKLDSIIQLNMIEYLDKNGLPAFENIGYLESSFAWDYMWGLFYVAWHDRYNENSQIKSKLTELVLNGTYRPDHYAALFIYNKGASDTLGLNPPSTKNKLSLEQQNNFRAQLYLESREDFLRKRIYMKKHRKQDKVTERNMYVFMNMWLLSSMAVE